MKKLFLLFVVIIFPYCSDAQFVIRFKDGSSIQLGGSKRHNKERLQYEQYVKSEKERRRQQYKDIDSLPQKPRRGVEDDNQRQQSVTERYFSDRKNVNNDKIVSLVVNGTGQTKEEAIKNALRGAIEQAFGTFVSANTEVLNDELIKDEIITVSTGNIKSFKELSVSQTSNGLYDASVQATVSIDQLTKFAQSKGMQAELAGASFVMNMKMRELNKKNEVLAINHLIEKAKAIADKGLFDYKLEIGEPKLTEDSKYEIKLKVLFCENANTREFYETIDQTFLALSLSEKEQQEYKSAGLKFFRYNKQLLLEQFLNKKNCYYLRDELPLYTVKKRLPLHESHYADYITTITIFHPIIMENALNYEIRDNIGNRFCCRKRMEPLSRYNPPPYTFKVEDNNSICVWFYIEPEKEILQYYELMPQNRLKVQCYYDWKNHYPITPITDFDKKPDSFNVSFNPAIDNEGKQKGFDNPNRIYYCQDFSVIYTEEELSQLSSITINHK